MVIFGPCPLVGAPFLWGPLFGRTCLNPPLVLLLWLVVPGGQRGVQVGAASSAVSTNHFVDRQREEAADSASRRRPQLASCRRVNHGHLGRSRGRSAEQPASDSLVFRAELVPAMTATALGRHRRRGKPGKVGEFETENGRGKVGEDTRSWGKCVLATARSAIDKEIFRSSLPLTQPGLEDCCKPPVDFFSEG